MSPGIRLPGSDGRWHRGHSTNRIATAAIRSSPRRQPATALGTSGRPETPRPNACAPRSRGTGTSRGAEPGSLRPRPERRPPFGGFDHALKGRKVQPAHARLWPHRQITATRLASVTAVMHVVASLHSACSAVRAKCALASAAGAPIANLLVVAGLAPRLESVIVARIPVILRGYDSASEAGFHAPIPARPS
jgi:hypothetical protein